MPPTDMVTVGFWPALARATEMAGRLFSPVWLPRAGVGSEKTGSSLTAISAAAEMGMYLLSVPLMFTVSLSPVTEAAGMVTV